MAENSNTRNTRGRQRPHVIIDSSVGHLQPQAVDVEKRVLGSLMIDSDVYTIVGEMLTPETFYDPRHQHIYEAIQKLSLQESPVDMITVADMLAKMGKLEAVGGAPYIVELANDTPSSAGVEYHAKIIAQKAMSRQLISYSANIQTKAFDESQDVDELMADAEGQLFEITQKNMKKDFESIGNIVVQAEDALLKASKNTGGITGIPTGYTDLDDVTSGWQPSDLVIIAGRPAMGKTAFALSLARNIAVDYNIPIAFFSLEMSNVQLANRLISNVCEIEGKKLLNGQLDKDEWTRYDQRIQRLKDAPIYVDDTPGMSIFELRSKARRLVREKGVRVLMIDYLQLMNATGAKFGSRQEEVSTISRSLKGLAKELDVPVLALSQLNRSVEGREGKGFEGKRPQLSDLRESGAIEQDADMVAFVHRPEYYHIYEDEQGRDLRGMAQIIIAKHRKGATKDVLLNFAGQYTRFQNPSESYVSPAEGGEIRGSSIGGGFDDPLASFPPPPGDAF